MRHGVVLVTVKCMHALAITEIGDICICHERPDAVFSSATCPFFFASSEDGEE